MSKKINSKPLTIKEYTKNYKFPEKAKFSLEDEYLHRTQNNFLSNIIQKKLKIKNKQIKIQKDEDLNKTIQNIFSKEEIRIRILNILKRRNHKISYTSDRLTISKSKTRDISHDTLYDKIKGQKSFDFQTPIKKYIKLNLSLKKKLDKPLTPLLHGVNKKKEKLNKNNDSIINKNNNTTITKKKSNRKKDDILSGSIYLKTESNAIKYNNKYNNNTHKNNIIKKIDKNNNKIVKNIEKSNKSLRNSKKPNKKNINLKIIKNCQITLVKKIKNFPKNFTQEKGQEIQILTNKDNNDNDLNYTGYILLKKNKGKIIENIKLDNNENNTKELLINIIKEITGEQNEIITKNDLLLLNKLKQDNNIKEQKIKEQELLIHEEKKLYLDLKNEFDKLLLENNNLKEKISALEIKENELKEINTNFTEYKKQKSEEIHNLEFLIKQYENQLNKIKQEITELKKYKIEKQQELFIEKLIKKKIDTNINNSNNKNNENINKEKDEKISRVLNKIKKKKLIENNNNEQNNIKKSDKINQLRKMLEQQIKQENKDNEKNKEKINEVKIEKTNKELDFLNLIDGKPINTNKKKPKNKINFIE